MPRVESVAEPQEFGLTADRPTPLPAEERLPARAPAPLATADPSFRYVQIDETTQQPVGYDRCRPVHYVMRPDGAPVGAGELIAESMSALSSATGLYFVDDGLTDEAPSRQRLPFQPERYGDRWAPVLVAWVTPDEQPDFAADVLGQAGSTSATADGITHVYVTGQVELDGPQVATLLQQPGGRTMVTAMIKHELGHLVGLDHVNDRSQLMYPEGGAEVTDYGAGDLAGLAGLVSGDCRPGL